MILTGVSGKFSATHDCPDGGGPHAHEWHVTAWFSQPHRADARCYLVALDTVLSTWEGTHLPPEIAWGEDIARTVGLLANCVEVVVSRPDERIYARWTDHPLPQGDKR